MYKARNKLYALHAPEVECIFKGKARTPYEFSVKVGVAVRARKGLVRPAGHCHAIPMTAMPSAPFSNRRKSSPTAPYGMPGPIRAIAAMTMAAPRHHASARAAQAESRSAPLRAMNRRSMIEAVISHMKNDGRHLARNWLKGAMGDAINAVLAGAVKSSGCYWPSLGLFMLG